VPTVRIDKIEFMELRLQQPHVAAHTLPINARVEGLLGTDLLNGLRLVVDFKSKYFEISS